MGKTRLLAEAARVARRLAFRVGVGAAEPGAGVVELAPLMTALFDGADPLLERPGCGSFTRCPSNGTGCSRTCRRCSSVRPSAGRS